jgi:hypothetical protein
VSGAESPDSVNRASLNSNSNSNSSNQGTQGQTSSLSLGGSASANKRTASEIAELLSNLDYPELQVVPRASERLRLEAKEEENRWLVEHWTFELSGLSTLAIGMMASGYERDNLSDKQKSDMGSVTNLVKAIGAGWVAAGVALGAMHPYESGLNRISKITGKDERSLLLRERLSEESLERPAKFIKPLIPVSVLTNFTMSLLLGVYLNDQGRVIAGTAAALAFLPVVFDDQSTTVYEKHLEYKKKIYGPVATSGLGFDSYDRKFYPKMALTWHF